MSTAINKSRSSTPSTSSAHLGTNQLKKMLASPKKEPMEPIAPLPGKPFHLSPPVIDPTPSDPDDFMNQLSQNTVSFHASTHSGGRPISPTSQRFTATPSPVEDPIKTRALAQVLALNSNTTLSTSAASAAAATAPSSSHVTKKTSASSAVAPITGIAMSHHPNGSKKVPVSPFSSSAAAADAFLTDKEISARNRAQQTQVALSPNSTKLDPNALLAPSDLTGCKFSFPT
jgi:hypothetical protein